jgi:hypothetical protein
VLVQHQLVSVGRISLQAVVMVCSLIVTMVLAGLILLIAMEERLVVRGIGTARNII